MPTQTSLDNYIAILDKAPAFSDAAVRHGPFFFGVFLVLIAFILILLNKNRYICGVFAICGILLMVWASFLYSGIGNPTHVYTMCLDNLTEDHQLVLTDSVPRLYKHNRQQDTERHSYHFDLITVSPIKLGKGHIFKVIILESISLTHPDGTKGLSYIQHKIPLSFRGEAHSTYELNRITSKEEEDLARYEIVYNTTTKEEKELSFWSHNHLVRQAHAEEKDHHVFFAEVPNLQVAQSEVSPALDNGTLTAFEEINIGGVSVIYFEKPADQGKVRAALSKAKISYSIQSSVGMLPTNAVWIGVDVPSDEAERIGTSLLAEGVDLRYFGYFTYSDTRTNVVQIGYSEINANNATITREDILSFTEQLRSKQNSLKEQIRKQQQINQRIQEKVKKQQQGQQKK